MRKTLLEKYQALEIYISALATEMESAAAKATKYKHATTDNEALAGMFYSSARDIHKLLLENRLTKEDFKDDDD